MIGCEKNIFKKGISHFNLKCLKFAGYVNQKGFLLHIVLKIF